MEISYEMLHNLYSTLYIVTVIKVKMDRACRMHGANKKL